MPPPPKNVRGNKSGVGGTQYQMSPPPPPIFLKKHLPQSSSIGTGARPGLSKRYPEGFSALGLQTINFSAAFPLLRGFTPLIALSCPMYNAEGKSYHLLEFRVKRRIMGNVEPAATCRTPQMV